MTDLFCCQEWEHETLPPRDKLDTPNAPYAQSESVGKGRWVFMRRPGAPQSWDLCPTGLVSAGPVLTPELPELLCAWKHLRGQKSESEGS